MPKLWLLMLLAALLLWMVNRTESKPIDVLAMMPTPGPAKGYVWVVVELGQPAVEVPFAFAKGAVARIGCESSWRTDVVNPETGATGLLQIHPIWNGLVEKLGYTWADMQKARPNLEVAQAIWRQSGWSPWACKGE